MGMFVYVLFSFRKMVVKFFLYLYWYLLQVGYTTISTHSQFQEFSLGDSGPIHISWFLYWKMNYFNKAFLILVIFFSSLFRVTFCCHFYQWLILSYGCLLDFMGVHVFWHYFSPIQRFSILYFLFNIIDFLL